MRKLYLNDNKKLELRTVIKVGVVDLDGTFNLGYRAVFFTFPKSGIQVVHWEEIPVF